MSREELQTVYKPVQLVTPHEANRLGIATKEPTFLSRGLKEVNLVFKPGVTVEGQLLPEGKVNKIFAFPNLKTALAYESVGYFGYVPYNGFIAVGETLGAYVTEPMARGLSDLHTMAEKIRVVGIKAFVEESEVEEGYVEEFIESYSGHSFLVIDPRERLGPGKKRYAFKVTKNGEVLFTEFSNDADNVLNKMKRVSLANYLPNVE